MVRCGDEVAAECVHLGERAYHTGVAEIVCVDTACEARAGGRLDSDDAVVRLAAELLAHERSDEAAEVGTAAGAADDHVGLDAVLVERCFGLETDDGLVQQDLIEDGSQNIAITGVGDRDFHGFGDRTAEGTGRAGVISEDLAADLGRHGWRRGDGRAVCAHHFAAERLLLIADLDHEHLAVEVKIGTRHRKRRTPLACSGLGGHAFEALFFDIIGLRNGGIELVTAACVVALELVVDMRGSPEFLLEAVRAYER